FVVPSPRERAGDDAAMEDVGDAHQELAARREAGAPSGERLPRIDEVLEDVGEDHAIGGGPRRWGGGLRVADMDVVEDAARAHRAVASAEEAEGMADRGDRGVLGGVAEDAIERAIVELPVGEEEAIALHEMLVAIRPRRRRCADAMPDRGLGRVIELVTAA